MLRLILHISALTLVVESNIRASPTDNTPRNEEVVFIFDKQSNVFATELNGSCFVTKLLPAVSQRIQHDTSKLKDFELQMVELLKIYHGQHKLLSLGEVLTMSSSVALKCIGASKLYEIYDPNHSLWQTFASTDAPSNSSVSYFFDAISNIFAVHLGDDCYITKLLADVAHQLGHELTLKDFETHLLEVIVLHQGRHTELTLVQLLLLSGNIATDCVGSATIYEVYDANHSLWITVGPGVTHITTQSTVPPSTTLSADQHPKDCYDVLHHGTNHSDLYRIYPHVASWTHGIDVYCDMVTDGGGWLVIQRRYDGTENFYQGWNNYANGFGDQFREFWIGNERIYQITTQTQYELRIDMEDFLGTKRYAMYNSFYLGNITSKYVLHISGYSGDAGDSLISDHNGMKFTTYDEDNDNRHSTDCALEFRSGGWWFNNCMESNLNGRYEPPDNAALGIFWQSFTESKNSLKKVEMKIRPSIAH